MASKDHFRKGNLAVVGGQRGCYCVTEFIAVQNWCQDGHGGWQRGRQEAKDAFAGVGFFFRPFHFSVLGTFGQLLLSVTCYSRCWDVAVHRAGYHVSTRETHNLQVNRYNIWNQ